MNDTPFADPGEILPESEPRPRGRYREFLISVADEEGLRSKGFGLTLDAVIAREVELAEASIGRQVPKHYPTADDCLADYNDVAIWSGPDNSRLVAAVLPRPGGVKVVRFDVEVPERIEGVGPIDAEASRTPKPGRPAPPELSEGESQVLDLARRMGIEEADFLLRIGGDLGREIVPGDRNSRTTEAIGRLLLLPEERFPWRRAAGYTSTDEESVALMERLRAEHPGYPVAEVLTHDERRFLTNIRLFGLAETQGVVSAVVALGLTIDEALGRLADDAASGTRVPLAASSVGTIVPKEQADEESEAWTSEDLQLRREHRRMPRAPFVVAQEDSLLYFSDRRYDSLADVIGQEVKDGGPDEDADRAIWRQNRLLAVVRLNRGREPEVIRLDRPAS